ncbi:C-type natriuretic peptide 4-like [Anguilla rostrata]|uniref:C-type natriuretic peptide-4 n=1 Tax=Anguilla japonica TaxID=7937 RepID=D2KXA5_ANGJA|nr:C-type natriuretic peptide-4 [Anguilla japonica]
MNVSQLMVCGLLMALFSFSTEAKSLIPAQEKSLRNLLGEELSEYLASGERERNLESARSRLLRDLRLNTRARGMWSRIMNDQPASRKQKTGVKKGASTPARGGCFGHKLDRISTLSGMGC